MLSFFAVALGISQSHAVIVNGTAIEIDFNDFDSGTLVGFDSLTSRTYLQRYRSSNNSDLDPGQGFDLKVINPNNYDDAGSLYDTDRTGGEDPDLEFNFDGGNQVGIRQGNALIIQESFDGNDIANGKLDLKYGQHQGSNTRAPDDEAGGGYLKFYFESGISEFGFTFIDLEESAKDTIITFRDSNTGMSASVGFDEFVSGGLFDQTGVGAGQVVWGNNHANKINPISVADLNNVLGKNFTTFDQVKFRLKGSGGISNMYYNTGTPVPEASTLLGGAGVLLIIGFHFWRRRKAALQSQ